MSYSSFFETIHDETEPVGIIGRGTHHSILRALLWRDAEGSPLLPPIWHIFAVIWDEDHDERIIGVVEALYLSGLLSSVKFIGERKAILSIILNGPKTGQVIEKMHKTCAEAVEYTGDVWDTRITLLEDELAIIQFDDGEARTYLSNISNMWRLDAEPQIARIGE